MMPCDVCRPAAFHWPEQPAWKDNDEDDGPEPSEAIAEGIAATLHLCISGMQLCTHAVMHM